MKRYKLGKSDENYSFNIMLPIGVLFLSAFVNNTLYVQVDSRIRETAICLSIDNIRNDSWPSKWKPMSLNNNNGIFTYKINDTIINKATNLEYKLRIFNVSRLYTDTSDWLPLYQKAVGCTIWIMLFIVTFILFFCLTCYVTYNYYK